MLSSSLYHPKNTGIWRRRWPYEVLFNRAILPKEQELPQLTERFFVSPVTTSHRRVHLYRAPSIWRRRRDHELYRRRVVFPKHVELPAFYGRYVSLCVEQEQVYNNGSVTSVVASNGFVAEKIGC